MPFITAEQAAVLRGGIVRPALLFFMDSTPAVRAWTGPGPFEVPPDTVDAAGGIYRGVGALSGMPAVDALINGVASRVDFTLSGLPEGYISLADEDAETTHFARLHMGAWFLGEDWQAHPLFSSPLWLWRGRVDTFTAEMSMDDEGNASATVTLSVGGGDTGRKSQRQSYWTGTDQRRRSPDDGFCDLTINYPAGVQKRWPA